MEHGTGCTRKVFCTCGYSVHFGSDTVPTVWFLNTFICPVYDRSVFMLWFVSSLAKQLRKASVSRVVRLSPSFREEKSDSHRTTFPQIPLLAFLVIFVNTLRLQLKSDKNNGHSAWTPAHICDPPSWWVFDRDCVLCEVWCEAEETVDRWMWSIVNVEGYWFWTSHLTISRW